MMGKASTVDHETREKILMLLSDDEVASASTAETTARPLEGEDYLDLEDLDRGVRSALGSTPTMSHLLLRRSVHKDTWEKILDQLAAHHTAKARTGS
jgi:hypothetical protein